MPLTHVEQMLLEAIQAAVRDERVPWETVEPEQWEALFDLAAAHKVLPLVYEAVYQCPAAERWPRRELHKREAVRQVTVQTVRTAEFHALYEYMQTAGLHPLVVKGILCRSMYPRGDYRISSDEDLLVPAEEWSSCCQALREYGMEPVGRTEPDAFETGWTKGPLFIELHRALFAPDSDAYGDLNEVFAGAHDRAMDYPVEGGRKVCSLSPHDHMLYLLLHAYKHFIHSGFGIRQVCDIGLWALCYRGEIEWLRLREQCEAAHALRFAASVFALAQSCLGMELSLPEEWLAAVIDPEPMLHDILKGGVYGSSDRSRMHSAAVTLNAVAAQRQEKRGSALAALFPSRKLLVGRYPVLRDHPALLPGVWCVRLARYAGELLGGERSSAADSMRIARERTELLKRYDILG